MPAHVNTDLANEARVKHVRQCWTDDPDVKGAALCSVSKDAEGLDGNSTRLCATVDAIVLEVLCIRLIVTEKHDAVAATRGHCISPIRVI